MSALTPANGKYRSMWKIFGKQLADKDMCKNYAKGYDEITWDGSNNFKEEQQALAGHKIIRFKKG